MSELLKDLPLSRTSEGRQWCLKALHPADHEVKATQRPGSHNIPTVSMMVTSYAVLPQPVANLREIELIMRADPIVPVIVRFKGETTAVRAWYNPMFKTSEPLDSTPSYSEMRTAGRELMNRASSYRINALSLTGEMVVDADNDRGQIISSQYQIPTNEFVLIPRDFAGGGVLRAVGCRSTLPDTASLLQGTRSYTGPARDGFYVPYKLDSFDWVSTSSWVVQAGNSTMGYDLCGGSLYAPMDALAMANKFPLFTSGEEEVVPTLQPQGQGVSLTRINGTDPSASIRLTLNMVVEMIVRPGTPYSAFTKPPLAPDQLALDMYMEISAMMNDAYPASFNDANKLKRIIGNLAKGVWKYLDPVASALSVVPGPLGQAAAGVSMVGKAVDAMVKKKPGKVPAKRKTAKR